MVTSRRGGRILCSVVIASILAAAAPEARAEPPSGDRAAVAQALFDEAMTLVKAGKHAEACPKLEQSQKLDPGMGTQFRLAECYERVGKIASAWALFVEVADAAKQQGNAARETQARKLAEALRPRLAKLAIRVPSELASLPAIIVKRDDVPVASAEWGLSLPVNPGEHLVTASASGKKSWHQKITVGEAATVEVSVPLLENDVSAPPPDASTQKAPPPPAAAASKDKAAPREQSRNPSRVGPIVMSSIGISGIAVGIAFGEVAGGQWNEALDLHCVDRNVTKCNPRGIELGKTAKTSAIVSTVGFGLGGAALVTALIMWIAAPSPAPAKARTPPPKAWQVIPSVAANSAGCVIQGQF